MSSLARTYSGLLSTGGAVTGVPRRFASSHEYRCSFAYVALQELCAASGYTVSQTLPFALRRASTVFSLASSGTILSLAPWNTQIGIPLMRSTSAGSPPPQMGAIAANRSGYSMAVAHVPNPPILRPVQ